MTQDRSLYRSLIRLHILYHAAKEPIFGAGISEELLRHGYRLSAGTLYPMLHRLEQEGLLRASHRWDGGRYRRLYRATPVGRKVLDCAKVKVRELFAELFEED